MKKTLLLLIIMSMAGLGFAQTHWTPTIGYGETTMSATCVVQINGTEVAADDVEIGAFYGDECRGAIKLSNVSQGVTLPCYFAWLTIYGINNDEITFKLYDHSTQKEMTQTSSYIMTWVENAMLGTLIAPVTINFTGNYNITPIVNGETGTDFSVTPGNAIGEQSVTAPAGYTFMGWSSVEIATAQNVAPSMYTSTSIPARDMTLHAVFAVNVNGSYFGYTTSVTEITDPETISGNPVWEGSIAVSSPVTIPAGSTLTVNGILVNTDPVNLVIEEGSQIIVNNAGVQATVKQSIKNAGTRAGWSGGWNFISSPVTAQATASFAAATGTGDYDLYKWDGAATLPWVNKKAHVDDFDANFVVGRGYLAAYETADNFHFTGELNVGTTYNYVLTEYNSENNMTWLSLLGNPYSYDLNWADFSMTNVYGGFATIVGSVVTYHTSGTIPVGEGFMVCATGASPQLSYSKGSGSRDASNDEFINVTIANGQSQDNAIIRLTDNVNGGFEKVAALNESNASLYIASGSSRYAIRDFEKSASSVAMSFKSPETSYYTLSVNTEGKFSYLHLLDKVTGENIDLLAQKGSYTFIGTPSDIRERFVIMFSNNGIGESPVNSSFNCYYNNNLVINGLDGNAEIGIFDIQGRLVKSYSATGSLNEDIDLSSGVYVVRVTDNNGTKTQKIVVNN